MARLSVLVLREHLRALLAIAVFVGTLLFLISGILVSQGEDEPPFFIDEAHKLGETYYWHLLFEEGDVHDSDWSGDFYARTNPPVAKYIYGAALSLGGYHVRTLELENDFDRLWKQPVVLRSRVPDGMLRNARLTSAVFGALLCTTLFSIGCRLGGLPAGAASLILLLADPVIRFHARVAMADSVLLFFSVLVVPVTLWAVRVSRRLREAEGRGSAVFNRLAGRVGLIAAPALAIGLATGTRLSGALGGAVYLGGLAWGSARSGDSHGLRRRLRSAVLVGVAGLVAAALLFVAINPYYYHHPVDRAWGTLRTYRDWVIKQQIDPGAGLFTLRERATAAGYFTLRRQSLPLPRCLGVCGEWLSGLGCLIGIAHLIDRTVRRGKIQRSLVEGVAASDSAADAGIVLWWIVASLSGSVVALPLMWARYLLLPQVVVVMATALGLTQAPRALRAILREARTRFAGASGIRVATMSLAVAGAWVVVSLTSWVIAPELLEPGAMLAIESRADLSRYAIAARDHPASPTLQRNYGLVLVRAGDYRGGLAHLERALEMLPAASSTSTATVVQRCRLLYEIAFAKMRTGDTAAAATLLEQDSRVIAALRDAMESADPMVRAEFDRTIADRRRMQDTSAPDRRIWR